MGCLSSGNIVFRHNHRDNLGSSVLLHRSHAREVSLPAFDVPCNLRPGTRVDLMVRPPGGKKTIFMALLWVPWHLFLWIGEGRDVMKFSLWISSYLLKIPSGIILYRVYNRRRGSLLSDGIAHASANTIVTMIQPIENNIMIIVFFVFTTVIVLADRMWRRFSVDHPTVVQTI